MPDWRDKDQYRFVSDTQADRYGEHIAWEGLRRNWNFHVYCQGHPRFKDPKRPGRGVIGMEQWGLAHFKSYQQAFDEGSAPVWDAGDPKHIGDSSKGPQALGKERFASLHLEPWDVPLVFEIGHGQMSEAMLDLQLRTVKSRLLEVLALRGPIGKPLVALNMTSKARLWTTALRVADALAVGVRKVDVARLLIEQGDLLPNSKPSTQLSAKEMQTALADSVTLAWNILYGGGHLSALVDPPKISRKEAEKKAKVKSFPAA